MEFRKHQMHQKPLAQWPEEPTSDLKGYALSWHKQHSTGRLQGLQEWAAAFKNGLTKTGTAAHIFCCLLQKQCHWLRSLHSLFPLIILQSHDPSKLTSGAICLMLCQKSYVKSSSTRTLKTLSLKARDMTSCLSTCFKHMIMAAGLHISCAENKTAMD